MYFSRKFYDYDYVVILSAIFISRCFYQKSFCTNESFEMIFVMLMLLYTLLMNSEMSHEGFKINNRDFVLIVSQLVTELIAF